jgi:DNA-binding NarL/FixJ family response regulator
MNTQISVALIDDHRLFRASLVMLLKSIGIRVALEASDGFDLIAKLDKAKIEEIPSLFIVDINMPGMDGFSTVGWIRSHLPNSKVIVLTMDSSESSVLKMVKMNVQSFLPKDLAPEELEKAVKEVADGRYYFPNDILSLIVASHNRKSEEETVSELSEKEIEFITLACTDMTYSEIADRMRVSVRTVDNYRAELFEKFKVKSRVQLALKAVRTNLVKI